MAEKNKTEEVVKAPVTTYAQRMEHIKEKAKDSAFKKKPDNLLTLKLTPYEMEVAPIMMRLYESADFKKWLELTGVLLGQHLRMAFKENRDCPHKDFRDEMIWKQAGEHFLTFQNKYADMVLKTYLQIIKKEEKDGTH